MRYKLRGWRILGALVILAAITEGALQAKAWNETRQQEEKMQQCKDLCAVASRRIKASCNFSGTDGVQNNPEYQESMEAWRQNRELSYCPPCSPPAIQWTCNVDMDSQVSVH